MQRLMKFGLWSGVLVAASALAALAALAQTPAEFYAGRQVTLIVPAGPGGGYSLYGQLLSRHLDKHIPGKPTIVIQHMPGGGGNVAANYLYNTAPKDGLVIAGLFSTISVTQALQPSGARFDATKFSWLGSVAPMVNALGIWHKAPAVTIEDAKTKEVIIGATGKSADLYLYPALMNGALGTKFKIVLGYESSGAILLAMENGEVHGMALGLEIWMSTRPEWMKDKKVHIVAQTGLKRDKLVPEVPTLIELAKTPEDEQLMTFVAAPAALGRVVAAPPGIPADRLAALRKAFDNTMRDPEFLKDLASRGLSVDPTPGTDIVKVIEQAYATPRSVIDRAKQLLGY